MNKHILVVSQVIPQWYVDVLIAALPDSSVIDIITGSRIDNPAGTVFCSPTHNATSFLSRLKSWFAHRRFVKKWTRRNKGRQYDLIFATSNPPINGYIGLKLKKAFHAPFLFMNWDLYPQCIDYMIRNPVVHMACKGWHAWNSRNFPKIDRMLTVGKTVAESINRDLRTPLDIAVIPIGADTARLNPIPKHENRFRAENGLEDKFIVLYSGKMGFGHNIELILDASEILRENDDIVFVFIGEGQKYGVIEEYINKNNASNVRLFPLQPEELFPFSMACGDVGVVAEESKMAHLFMPSKTYSMMACGMAILGICTEHDDLYDTVQKCHIGFCTTNESAKTLAEQILALYHDPELLRELKANARECAETLYGIPTVTAQYRALFEKYL